MRCLFCLLIAASAIMSHNLAIAAKLSENSVAAMPVREVTVFKDGHAFVVHEGDAATDENGNVHLNYLPNPVLGTFWPYSADKNVKLKSVAAGKHRVDLKRTALSIRELLESNVGARVEILEETGKGEQSRFRGKILSIPERSADELEAAATGATMPLLPSKGDIILLQSDEGTRAIPISKIQDVTFPDAPDTQHHYQEIRNLLRMQMDWNNQPKQKTTRVGLTYLQKGIRWIPQYRLTLNDDGTVLVQLQATLLNEMTDLKNVTAHLVVGVPSIQFAATTDPIALQKQAVALSSYFNAPANRRGQLSNGFSNSIMSQQVMVNRHQPQPVQPGVDLGPEVAGSEKNESLFMFSLENVTLAKGERMAMTVGEWTMKYDNVYKLNIPFAPPTEVQQRLSNDQQREMAKLLNSPKAKHVVRLTNDSKIPLTTAPALLMSSRGILGQGLMTYTAPGGISDITVTTAINIGVKQTDDEAKRTAQASKWNGHVFDRIDVAGRIEITNFDDKPVTLEVTRDTLGRVDTANADGKITHPNAWSVAGNAQPSWWGWYSWPRWWSHMNPRSEVKWTLELPPGKQAELAYEWHYSWTW